MANKIVLKQKTTPKITSILLITAGVVGVAFYITAVLSVISPTAICVDTNESNVLMKISSLFTYCKIPSAPKPTPLSVVDLEEVYTDMFDHPFGQPGIRSCNTGRIVFYSGQTELGQLAADKSSCPGIMPYTDGSVYNGGNVPLKALIKDGDILLNQHLTIRAGNGNTYTLCLPSLTTNQLVYFDIEGTPYFDVGLTRRAINESCKAQLSRGTVFNVYNADVNTIYPSGFDYNALARGSFNYPDVWEFGYLFADDRGFDREAMCSDCYLRAYGNTPLAIAPHPANEASFPLDLPSDVVTVWNEHGEVKNICLPPTILPGNPSDSEVYYVGVDGTVYKDAFLTQPAMTEKCTSILNRSYHPNDLLTAGLSQFIGDATIIFHRGQPGDVNNQLGSYNENIVIGKERQATQWVDGNSLTGNTGRAPLIIALQNKTSALLSLKDQVISLVDETSSVITTCVPATALEPGQNLLYYIDKYGTTYSDSLLQNRVITQQCQDMLTKAVKPKQISSAQTTILPDHAAIAFTRGEIYDPKLLGSLRWDSGWIDGDLLSSNNLLKGNAPLVVALQNYSANELIWPQQNLTITTDVGVYHTCIPEQVIPSGLPLLFYLGNDNALYRDAFLQEKLSC